MIRSRVLFCLCLLSCLSTAISAESCEANCRTDHWSLLVYGGAGDVNSGNVASLLGGGTEGGPGDFTARYGTTYNVFRNTLASAFVAETSIKGVRSAGLEAEYAPLDWLRLGIGFTYSSYKVTNIRPGFRKLTGTIADINSFFLLSPADMFILPRFHAPLIDLEFIDPLLSYDAYAINTLALNLSTAIHPWSGGTVDPYFKFSMGYGKDLYRSLQVAELGVAPGIQFHLWSSGFIFTEASFQTKGFRGKRDKTLRTGTVADQIYRSLSDRPANSESVTAVIREASFRVGIGQRL